MQTFKLSDKKSPIIKLSRRGSYHPFNVYYIFKCQYLYKLHNYSICDERITIHTHKMLYTDYI